MNINWNSPQAIKINSFSLWIRELHNLHSERCRTGYYLNKSGSKFCSSYLRFIPHFSSSLYKRKWSQKLWFTWEVRMVDCSGWYPSDRHCLLSVALVIFIWWTEVKCVINIYTENRPIYMHIPCMHMCHVHACRY